jgi:hypothetical protein
MTIVVLTSPHHLYANVVLNALLAARPGGVVAAWESGVLLPGRSFAAAVARYLAVAGPRYVAAQAVKRWAFRLGRAAYALRGGDDPAHPWRDWRREARRRGATVGTVADVNAPAFLDRLRAARPDVLLSVFFNQILGAEALAVAPRAYNLHPAPLPAGRGVSPTFWALARGAAEAGVTWHAMTAAVDGGPPAARETFDAAPFRSEHALYLEAARRGARLLPRLLDAVERGAPPAATPPAGASSSYDSLPTRAAYAGLRRRGAALVRARELVRP